MTNTTAKYYILDITDGEYVQLYDFKHTIKNAVFKNAVFKNAVFNTKEEAVNYAESMVAVRCGEIGSYEIVEVWE